MARRATGQRSDLTALLAAKEMVLVCGSGGVGKTTTAAAMAVAAATEIGGRVLVLTVDPAQAARRRARRRQDRQHATAGARRGVRRGRASTPRGELWAAMLDTKAGWDELIRRHAPDAKVRDAVLANPLYQNITSRFVHSHDYLAMEQLHELHASGEYDLIIVDTPPSRNALDVLDAPGRMKEFFGVRLLQVAHRAVPVAAVHDGLEALLPGRRPRARLALPAGHRRVLHAVPGDGARVRRPRHARSSSCSPTRAPRSSWCPRSRRRRATRRPTCPASSSAAAFISERSSPIGSCRRSSRRRPPPPAPASSCSAATDGLADDVATVIDADPGVVADVLSEIGVRFDDTRSWRPARPNAEPNCPNSHRSW